MSKDIAPESRILAAKNQVSCEVDGEVVILDMQDGTYFGLNAVGASVWKLLTRPCTLPQLREAIAAEYDVEPSRCDADIDTLLQHLLEHKLIEVEL